jgi:hypothetical protein
VQGLYSRGKASFPLNFMRGATVKRSFHRVILGLAGIFLVGCSSLPEWQVTPPAPNVYTKWVDITVTPILDRQYAINVGYIGVILEVRNKTNQDVTINWDETFYLQAGRPNGGFSLQGTLGARLRGFDIILARETFVTTIYPAVLANPSGISTLSDPKLNWAHRPMPTGENGIDIKLRAGSDEVRQSITFTISG